MAQLLIPRELQSLDRSTSKLTEVAKRVAIPADIVGTDWGPVAETCREEMGIEFDGWQDGMGQLMLARNTEESLDQGGMLAHTVGGFNLSAMRQCGKSFWGSGSLFGLCQHYPELLVIWTAHHSRTSDETFESMQGFAERRRIKPFIERVLTGSGNESINFRNGSRIMLGARERGFGRGIPGVDVLFNDEGQIMSEKAQQAMLATMNTSWLGLHIYAGTPPASEDLSKAQRWMTKHDEVWENKDPNTVVVYTEDTVWVELGADDGCDPDDIHQWIRNPSTPHRTPFHAIQRLRRGLTLDGFMREGLGVYDAAGGSIFDMGKWGKLAEPDADEVDRAALVVDVSPNRSWSSIGIAGELTGVADSADELERVIVMVKSMPGTRGVAEFVDQLNEERDLMTIKITPNAARSLETRLTKLGVPYEIMSSSEVNASYGTLQEAIKDGTVAHLDQPELDMAMVNTKTRMLQTGEAESFDRREQGKDDVDTSPAVAVACALYEFGINNEAMPFIG